MAHFSATNDKIILDDVQGYKCITYTKTIIKKTRKELKG